MIGGREVIKASLGAWIHVNTEKRTANTVGIYLLEHKQIGGGRSSDGGAFIKHGKLIRVGPWKRDEISKAEAAEEHGQE